VFNPSGMRLELKRYTKRLQKSSSRSMGVFECAQKHIKMTSEVEGNQRDKSLSWICPRMEFGLRKSLRNIVGWHVE
jgi:hypothetical protein